MKEQKRPRSELLKKKKKKKRQRGVVRTEK
jgi:hypothetical protein